jgi:DNA-binding transcriptional LysR family regulator
VSGRIALWEGFLPHWVAWMREAAPDVSLRLEIGFEADIMQGLIEGTVDIGVMYTPTSRTGLVVEPLFDETLLLVTSDLARGWPDDGYIHIDWGPEFHAQFSDQFPDVPPPTLVANIGWLGVQQLLTYGGSGYFPLRLVRAYIEAGQLWRVPDAPQFKLPAWIVFPRDSQSGTLKAALDGLRELARAEQASEK